MRIVLQLIATLGMALLGGLVIQLSASVLLMPLWERFESSAFVWYGVPLFISFIFGFSFVSLGQLITPRRAQFAVGISLIVLAVIVELLEAASTIERPKVSLFSRGAVATAFGGLVAFGWRFVKAYSSRLTNRSRQPLPARKFTFNG